MKYSVLYVRHIPKLTPKNKTLTHCKRMIQMQSSSRKWHFLHALTAYSMGIAPYLISQEMSRAARKSLLTRELGPGLIVWFKSFLLRYNNALKTSAIT